MIERREFTNFTLERVFNVISAEGAEVAEANELVRIPVGPLRFNEFSERRTNVVADGAVLLQERPTTNLAIEFSRRLNAGVTEKGLADRRHAVLPNLSTSA